jgi:threonine aldolase
MRQAGIVAAAGLYALDHNVDRLREDHARATRLAEAWTAAGLPARAETNFVQLEVADVRDALDRLAAAGVALSPARPGVLRAVTHLDVTDADVERAAALVPASLGAARAG